jgi:exodeoxyribonuclease VII large subunit
VAERELQPKPVLPKRPLRVGEVTRYLIRTLDRDSVLNDLNVVGEVVEISRSPSGHVYFRLKEGQAVLPCVIWQSDAFRQRSELSAVEAGMNVVVHGAMTIYEVAGRYQMKVVRVQVQGAGAARLQFERLYAVLDAEGLFAGGRKRPLPPHPRTIAVVTSPESEGYHDVIKRLRTQWPMVTVILASTTVQGEGTPGEIDLALSMINRMTNADVVLIVRGGGSPDELAWYNDERVARAIFASRIPVVTGIGHERDESIADLVADARAPTPTAAAALVVPNGPELHQRSLELQRRIRTCAVQNIARRRQRVRQLERGLAVASPSARVSTRRQRADELTMRLMRVAAASVDYRRRRLSALTSQLSALDPDAILARGFAVLTDADSGAVVASVDSITAGQRLRARVKDGTFTTHVDARG